MRNPNPARVASIVLTCGIGARKDEVVLFVDERTPDGQEAIRRFLEAGIDFYPVPVEGHPEVRAYGYRYDNRGPCCRKDAVSDFLEDITSGKLKPPAG